MLTKSKRVMITGACGTVGAELIKQLNASSAGQPEQIIAIDQSEGEIFNSSLGCEYSNVVWRHCYIQDVRQVSVLMRGVDVVIHTAAMKHVAISENNPESAIQTNILGTQSLIEAALANEVSHFIYTSSDKAVNPTNVMGTSKLMGERLVTAANYKTDNARTRFSSTRFGNVLGSNGSVIPIFKRQLIEGGVVTVTHPDMTRFVMSIEQSVALILGTLELMSGGEVFVTKMPVVNIEVMAKAMSLSMFGTADIEVDYIGIKPGEKLYEELMTDEEVRRTVELDQYFIVVPALEPLEKWRAELLPKDHTSCERVYNSSTETCLDLPQTVSLLETYNLAGVSPSRQNQRQWPGDALRGQ